MGDTAAALVIGAFAAVATALTVSVTESDSLPKYVKLKPWDVSKFTLDNGKRMNKTELDALTVSKNAYEAVVKSMETEFAATRDLSPSELRKYYEKLESQLIVAVAGIDLVGNKYYKDQTAGDIPQLIRSSHARLAYVTLKARQLGSWSGKNAKVAGEIAVYVEDPFLHAEAMTKEKVAELQKEHNRPDRPPSEVMFDALEALKRVKVAQGLLELLEKKKDSTYAALETNIQKHMLIALHSQLHNLSHLQDFNIEKYKDDASVKEQVHRWQVNIGDTKIDKSHMDSVRALLVTQAVVMVDKLKEVDSMSAAKIKDVYTSTEYERSELKDKAKVEGAKAAGIKTNLASLIPHIKENKKEVYQKIQEWTRSRLKQKEWEYKADEKVIDVLTSEFPEAVEYCSSAYNVRRSYSEKLKQAMPWLVADSDRNDVLTVISEHTLNKSRIKEYLETPRMLEDAKIEIQGLVGNNFPDIDKVARKYALARLKWEAGRLAFSPLHDLFSTPAINVDATALIDEYALNKNASKSVLNFSTPFKAELAAFVARNEKLSWDAGVNDMIRISVVKFAKERGCIFKQWLDDSIDTLYALGVTPAVSQLAFNNQGWFCNESGAVSKVAESKKEALEKMKHKNTLKDVAKMDYETALNILTPISPRLEYLSVLRHLALGLKKAKLILETDFSKPFMSAITALGIILLALIEAPIFAGLQGIKYLRDLARTFVDILRGSYQPENIRDTLHKLSEGFQKFYDLYRLDTSEQVEIQVCIDAFFEVQGDRINAFNASVRFLRTYFKDKIKDLNPVSSSIERCKELKDLQKELNSVIRNIKSNRMFISLCEKNATDFNIVKKEHESPRKVGLWENVNTLFYDEIREQRDAVVRDLEKCGWNHGFVHTIFGINKHDMMTESISQTEDVDRIVSDEPHNFGVTDTVLAPLNGVQEFLSPYAQTAHDGLTGLARNAKGKVVDSWESTKPVSYFNARTSMPQPFSLKDDYIKERHEPKSALVSGPTSANLIEFNGRTILLLGDRYDSRDGDCGPKGLPVKLWMDAALSSATEMTDLYLESWEITEGLGEYRPHEVKASEDYMRDTVRFFASKGCLSKAKEKCALTYPNARVHYSDPRNRVDMVYASYKANPVAFLEAHPVKMSVLNAIAENFDVSKIAKQLSQMDTKEADMLRTWFKERTRLLTESDSTKTMSDFIIAATALEMDLYSLGRMLRNFTTSEGKTRPTKIIIYTGSAHTRNYLDFLTQAGGTITETSKQSGQRCTTLGPKTMNAFPIV